MRSFTESPNFYARIAGASYLINSIALLVAPSLTVFPILMLAVLNELTLALWLIVKGVDTEKWRQAVGR